MKVYIGRIVAVATAVCSLILAVLPVVGNFDWRSTAGVIAGIAAITAVAQKWLTGLQAHEARVGDVTADVLGKVAASVTNVPSSSSAVTSGGDPDLDPAKGAGERIARELGVHDAKTADPATIPFDRGDDETADKDRPDA